MNNPYPNNTKAAWYIVIFMVSLLILVSLLTGCAGTYYIMDPVYEDHPHTTEVYWYTDYEMGGSPYFGYWNSFYYYYGVPHYYPWWYYYQFIPPHHHYTHTHIHVHCDNGHYVYGHRGPTFNNQAQKDFRPTIKLKNKKDQSFVFPREWKSNNSTINKQNYNRTFNLNNSNVNKNNNKSINTNYINKNRSNNKQKIKKSNRRP